MQLQLEDTRLFDLVRDTIARWRDGEHPDAAAVLKRHPDLSRHKSLAVDLIYEEYCLRSEAGDTLLRGTFCDQFPGYQQSLVKMLEVHEALAQSEALEPLVWPQVGESFAGYDLVDSLGRGSLARVYLARERALGERLVVVKISQDGAREAQMLGKVSHPAIVPVFSVQHDAASGWTAICMPLLGTATATDLLDAAFAGGKPPVDASVVPRVAGQFRPVGTPRDSMPRDMREWTGSYSDGVARLGLCLAEGLQAAHDAGIMHRDIKPSNVLLSWSGRPMLLDFNLSTDVSLVSQRVGGTLPYMAPELMQALNASNGRAARQFDARADVFSLGAVLYHLLTGELPARPEHADSLPCDAIEPWLACRQQEVQAPRSLNRDVQPELSSIVLRCLAQDVHGRYASAESLAEALSGYLSPLAQGKRTLRRHRRILLCGVASLAVAGISGAIYSSNLAPYEERLFAQGIEEYEQGEYVLAATTFEKCLELRTNWPEAHFARGQSLRRSGNFELARGEFLAIKQEHPAVAGAMIGFCCLEQGDADAALREYSLAVAKGDRSPETLTNYAHCLRSQQQFGPAMDNLTEALEGDPEFAVAYYQRATCCLQSWHAARQQGEESDEMLLRGMEDSRRACELAPEEAHYFFLAAVIGSTLPPRGPEKTVLPNLVRAQELGFPVRSTIKTIPKLSVWGEMSPICDFGESTSKASDFRKHAVPSTSPALALFNQ
jgi:serine/threonine protein kinase